MFTHQPDSAMDDIDINYLKRRLRLPELQRYELIKLSVCHGSYINEAYIQQPAERERLQREIKRLAHIGDGIMNMAITDYFFHRLPDADQKILTERTRPFKERRRGAAGFAREIGLDCLDVCKLGRGIGTQDKEGDMFGEMFEALMGAIYLESGCDFAVVRNWFQREFSECLNEL